MVVTEWPVVIGSVIFLTAAITYLRAVIRKLVRQRRLARQESQKPLNFDMANLRKGGGR